MRSLLRVIKAEHTRLLTRLSTPATTVEETPIPPPIAEAAPPETPPPETQTSREADIRQAYEELINTAQEEVSLMLQEARAEATEIYKQAEEDIRRMRQSVHDEAYQLGLKKAEEEVTALLEQAQKEVDTLLAQAKEERDKMLDAVETQILRLAIDTADKILGLELEQNNAAFVSMLKQALSSVKAENQVVLRVNPSEYVRFFKAREVTLHTQNGSISATVINDPTVGYGGCLIETESGTVDAGAKAQLSQIAQNFGLDPEDYDTSESF